MFVFAGLLQQLEKSRYTGCPGGAVAPPGTGYFQGPGSGETAALALPVPSCPSMPGRRVSRKDRRAMPRQRTQHSRITYALPDDFPQRLERFQEESGLSWSEIARRIGM